MSAKTRIKRPTTSTPRKLPEGRMVHQSTHYHTIQTPTGPRTLKAKGDTYAPRIAERTKQRITEG